jgi:hypothetical protein
VFVPTYALDVTPIEQAFATTRQALRRVGARSFATIVAVVGAALSTITTDAHAFFAHAGFPLASPELCTLLQGCVSVVAGALAGSRLDPANDPRVSLVSGVGGVLVLGLGINLLG